MIWSRAFEIGLELWRQGKNGLGHRQRRRRVVEQLPQLLRLLVTGLSAGYTLPQALLHAAGQLPPPLAQVVEELLARHRAGVSLADACGEWPRLYPGEETELLAAVLIFTDSTGSSSRAALRRVERLVVAKRELRDKALALSAQARLQGWVMTALPPLTLVTVRWIDPDFLTPLFATELGRTVLLLTILINLAGLLWIRKLTRFSI
jgi:tight adherence protein B